MFRYILSTPYEVKRSHGFFRNLNPKAANTKTMPIFAISRSQNRFLKNSKSTLTTVATNNTT